MEKGLKKYVTVGLITIGLIGLIIGMCILFPKNRGDNSVCIVTFDSNGGTEIVSQEIECGTKAMVPENPIKNGFDFIDWKNNEKTYNFDLPVEEDLLLIANYEPKENAEIIVVYFNENNENEIKEVDVLKGETLKSYTPIKHGYRFGGWYHNDNIFDFSNQIIESIELNAKWIEIEYSDENNTNSVNVNIDFEAIKNKYIGKWYLEGYSDVYVTVSDISKTQQSKTLNFISHNFCFHTEWVNELNGIVIYPSRFNPASWNAGATVSVNTWEADLRNNEISLEKNAILIGGNKFVRKKGTQTIDDYLKEDTSNNQDSNNQSSENNYVADQVQNTNELINKITGYYWYLDGYNHSYLYPYIENGNTLTWESENLELSNEKLISLEKMSYDEYKKYTSVVPYSSNLIHNELVAKPLNAFSHEIEEHKIRFVNDKLYITFGSKEYSFTKHKTKKSIQVDFTVDVTNVEVEVNEEFYVSIDVTPFYGEYCIQTNISDHLYVDFKDEIINMNPYFVDEFTYVFKGVNPGKATIKIVEEVSGNSKTINVTVKEKKPTEVSVSGISLNKSELHLVKGSSETLVSTIHPDNASNKNVVWMSSDANVVTVDKNGTVKAISKGNAIITAISENGNYQATCSVTVSNPPLTVKGSIGYSIVNSNGIMTSGIFVEVKPSGGSGTYTSYDIKLYKDNVLLTEVYNTTDNEIYVPGHKNGNYYAEFTVRDSEGNQVSGTDSVTISVG